MSVSRNRVNVANTIRDIGVVRLNGNGQNETAYSLRSRSCLSDLPCIVVAARSAWDDGRSRSRMFDDRPFLLRRGGRASTRGPIVHSSSIFDDWLFPLPRVR